jgi:hypothetical protein
VTRARPAGQPASALTRELACLALGHADADHSPCTATDDQLIRELVAEVRALHAQVDNLLADEEDPR